MELAQGSIGPEASYEAKFEGGKLLLSVKYAGTEAGGDLSFEFDAKTVVVALADKAKAAIPGSIDDMIIDTLLAVVLK